MLNVELRAEYSKVRGKAMKIIEFRAFVLITKYTLCDTIKHSMSTLQRSIAGIILAGGQGSRVAGADKGLILYQGQRLIDHAVNKLTTQTHLLIISANRHLKHYEQLGYAVIHDLDVTSYQGPMAGVSASLRYLTDKSNCDSALITSCDTPNIPAFLGKRLAQALFESTASVAVAHDGRRRQNLHCLIKREAWLSLIQHYENGERAMHRWQRKMGDIEVDFSDCDKAFENLNTLEQFNQH